MCVEEEHSIEVWEELLPPPEVIETFGWYEAFDEFGGVRVGGNKGPNTTHKNPT
jgi:hypothetical protein